MFKPWRRSRAEAPRPLGALTNVLPLVLSPSLWLIFIAVWIAMARGGKAVVARESPYSRLSHYLPLAIGAYLLASPMFPSPG